MIPSSQTVRRAGRAIRPGRLNSGAPIYVPGSYRRNSEESDAFSGSTLDYGKWFDIDPDFLGPAPGTFSRGNVSVDNELILATTADGSSDEGQLRHTYLTSAVKSKGTFLYGFYEIEARLSTSQSSSAWWFYKNDGTLWTEIDVFEFGGRPYTQLGGGDQTTLHTTAHTWVQPVNDPGQLAFTKKTALGVDLSAGYHRYGFLWTPGELRFFFDRSLIFSVVNLYWHQPLYMLFDSETFPSWFGLPEIEYLPSDWRVRNLQVWR